MTILDGAHHNHVRCELKSQINGMTFSENITGIDEWKHSWPKGEISYRLNSFSTDNISEKNQIRALTVALRAWQLRIKDLKFRRERNIDTAVDFDVWFQPGDHFSSDKVLGHAYFPGQGPASGDVEINDEDWKWATNVHESSLSRPPLTAVLIHEFGHSLGLRHDSASSSRGREIMYPSLNAGRPTIKLGPRDIQRIQTRYGKRRLSQRIIYYFIRRRIMGYDF